MKIFGPPPWVSKYIADVELHGPLSSPICVVRKGTTCQYQVQVGKESRSFLHHPLSPTGRSEWGDLLRRSNKEEKSRKADFPGVAHPPIVYKPSEWVWESMDSNIRTILISALQISNRKVTMKDLSDKKNVDAVKQIERNHRQLYHPSDRERLAMFEDEHKLSYWARHFGRGLIIVGPEFNLDRKNYSAHMQPNYKDRPALRARYSTGIREEFPPIVLGYLPNGTQAKIWFCLELVDTTKNVLKSL
jgi:hypothetical protein